MRSNRTVVDFDLLKDSFLGVFFGNWEVCLGEVIYDFTFGGACMGFLGRRGGRLGGFVGVGFLVEEGG